jgi:hypothetical protein
MALNQSTNLQIFNLSSIGLGARMLMSWLNMPSLSGIRLECYKYTESLKSKISEQMIVNLDGSGKNVVSDNIVPIPRIWNISAYIASGTVGFVLANNPPSFLSSQDQSLFSGLLNPIKMFTQGTGIPVPGFEPSLYFMPSLKLQVQVLRNAWLNNKLVWFKDKEGTFIPVAIESLDIESDPVVQNKVPVTLTLKEIIPYNGYSGGFNKMTNIPGTNLSAPLVPDVTNPASSFVSQGGGTPNFVSTGPQ